MLSSEKRLKAERDFKRVYTRGSFFSVELFNFNFAPNRLGTRTRIGIVVSKKVAAKAVARNLIKRKVREAARELYDDFPKGYDIIVNVKEKALLASAEQIKEALTKAAVRMGKNEKASN